MKKVFEKTQWMCVGLLAALMVGTSALADDTEILLINPNASNPPQSNILFIIDSSGSMGDLVETKEIYDPNTIYDATVGQCDPDTLYWTEVNTIPSCALGNLQYFNESAFFCQAAQSRLNGIGSYTGTMAQFYGDGAGKAAWQRLLPGNNTGLVECLNDSGIHGLGVAGEVYAKKGSTLTPYTSARGQEIDWSGDGVSNGVTVYDGNYLNYRAVPVVVERTKIDIVKQVSNVVMNSIEKVNVGIMRFNDSDGGPIIQDVVDLETNRADILAAINGIVPGGRTPLSEALYESARFWRGLPAYYGENITEHATDPGALAQLSPEIYEQPEMLSCTKNFNVLLTDGQPVDDQETPDLVDGLPNWSTTLGHAGCVGGNMGDCLDDVAEYLYKDDVNLTTPDEQLVTTHTIGFAIDLPVMKAAAAASGGEYFLANDVESLTTALLQIVSSVQERSLSFTAPAVAVNSFNRTQNLNDLYLTTFGARGKVHWPGNLKKYEIRGGQIVDATGAPAVNQNSGFFETNAQSFWSAGPDGIVVEAGGAASQLPPPSSRKLFTYNGVDSNLTSVSNELSVATAPNYSLADFGLTGGRRTLSR